MADLRTRIYLASNLEKLVLALAISRGNFIEFSLTILINKFSLRINVLLISFLIATISFNLIDLLFITGSMLHRFILRHKNVGKVYSRKTIYSANLINSFSSNLLTLPLCLTISVNKKCPLEIFQQRVPSLQTLFVLPGLSLHAN